MSAIETASMMSDIALNISQLRILLRILRLNIGAKLLEPDVRIKDVSGKMIEP